MSARLAVDVAPVAFAPAFAPPARPPSQLVPAALRAPPPSTVPGAPPPPRLRALLAAAGRGCDGMMLLRPAAAQAGVARLLRALAEAHALAHGGHALAGHALAEQGQALLVLAPAAGLPGLAEQMRQLDPAIGSALFHLPADSAALVAAAAPWFTAGSSARVVPAPETVPAAKRQPIAALARGLPPYLLGFRLVGEATADPAAADPMVPPLQAPGDLTLWHEPHPGTAPPQGFAGTALVGPALVAEPAILAIWRDRLAIDGGRLAIGPFGAATVRWLNLAAIPADLVLLQWSAALPAACGPDLPAARGADFPAARIVLTGADRPEALAWGLRMGIGAFAGTVVEALLAAQRLATCPYAAGCDAGACAARAAATTPAGRAGCGNPLLLARWAP